MKNICLDVKASIENLQNLFKNTDNENERLKKSNQEALEVFQKLESESLKELESLKNNEEWENFTIAFYGETGAGKSTLIECLRLFFKERSKMVQQERFRWLYSNYQNNYQNDERKKQAILNELHSLQDGTIMGDGRSDFTLETRSYTLKYNNKTFTLLDVPGIEGDEKKVIQLAGVGLAFVGIVKSVWSFFDSDYKKSQQRKEVDKNLDKACEKITKDVRNQIKSGKKGASEMIENLKASLNLVVRYERMREGL